MNVNKISFARIIALVFLLLLTGQAYADASAAEVLWIDVRTVDEYQSGHLDGAVNIEYEVIVEGVHKMGVAPTRTIYLYCRSGRRAGVAEASLREKGYLNVTNVGGLEDARKLTVPSGGDQ